MCFFCIEPHQYYPPSAVRHVIGLLRKDGWLYANPTKSAEVARRVPGVKSGKNDRRLVDFPKKRKLWKSAYIDDKGVINVRLDFRNGEVRTLSLAPSIMNFFAAEGAEKRVDMAIEGARDIDEAVRAIDALLARTNA